ncbi:coiled-coil and C2 domain-containing protein 1-like isoform X2 [Macrosteles quadrilineatus]|uniref:coiled-coil and C2 domain-containing protein 1-like isoform X2 n=1 Tax=Macrosteles quadrilineatus TaxID=74068 RepID=UPI0023E346FB|nr:coiled-coil and C2 domain-containing protein 1-like isoform X2 [Macrosteles quadrilineatus]
MFTRKKPTPKPKSQSRGGRNLSQYGLFDIPDVNNMGVDGPDDDDDDDDDLEAELMAITGDSKASHRPKKGPTGIVLPTANLDLMVAASLRDDPSDEDVSGDDDDPDLLDELCAITGDDGGGRLEAPPPSAPSNGVQVGELRERLQMYQEAETNAKSAGESARARRFSRGIKTLNDLIKQASAGHTISEDDIPPPVAVKITAPKTAPVLTPTEEPTSPLRPAPPPPIPPRGVTGGVALPGLANQTSLPETPSSPPPQVSSDEPSPVSPSPGSEVPSSPKKLCPQPEEPAATTDNIDNSETLCLLTTRRDEYKRAALVAKKSGDTKTAINYIKIAKQFDSVISGLEAGQPVDLSAMPPPPSASFPPPSQPITEQPRTESENQMSADTPGVAAPENDPGMDEPQEYVVEMPATVMEALEQRLAKYKSQEEAAKAEGNASKARRMGRIVKQYNDAIKLCKAGKPIPVDELPTPPGFPPIPVPGSAKPPPSPLPAVKPQVPTPALSVTPTPALVSPSTSAGEPSPQPSTSSPDKTNVRKMGGSHQERQLQQLLEKQKQFKLAAVQAKKKGEVNQAKEYLRLAKGFDKLIEASNCGLPVDMATVPVPPTAKVALESDFDIVTADDCGPSSPGSPGSEDDILEKLERDLIDQMKKSMETRNHFKAIGDVASANRFEQQALYSKKDLDVVRVTRKHKHPVPRFHYETRSFSIVQCNTDLGDNDLELTVAQGINYNVPNPKEVDTYVRFEFPWPTEEPWRDKTATVYNTNNPVYNEKFTIPIQRNVRACQRVFKRQAVKCEIWSKGGFFRGDSLIGTATVKLQPLETKCVLHESFDLMEGRKAIGGKLEVKIRIRNPIQTKQVERVDEKWLVIDR